MQLKKQIAQLFSFSIVASFTLALSPLPSQGETGYGVPLLTQQADTEDQILQSFVAKKNVVEQFFLSSPTLAEIQEDSRTTSGISVYMRRIPGAVSSFDLERTESLLNPYSGYVTIDYSEEKCGLAPEPLSDTSPSDFVTEEEALSVLENCPYWQKENADRNYDFKLVFLFEYSEAGWRLTNIDRYFNGRKSATDPGFDLAFYPDLPPTRSRIQVTNESLVQYNSKWNDLVISLLN